MAEFKKLQKNGTDIYPVTLEDVVFDSNGNTLPNKYQTKSDDTLNTVDKTVIGAINEVNTELAEVKQSVSNGKSLIASAITDKGIETLSDATFQTMADNIGLIESGSNLPSWCPNFWIEGEPSKVAMGLSSASINNEIYLIGGRSHDSVTATYYTDVKVYNIENNTWTKKATIPTPRCWLTSDVINNKIYSIGGYTSKGMVSTNECYDPLTNTWSSKTSSPWNVFNHTSSVVDNNIYLIGGQWGDNTSNNYCYDTLTDSWSAKAKTSTNRYKPTSNAIGDKIYCMGGYVNNVYNDNLCYDTLMDTWSTKSSMLTATYGLVSEVINNKIYCIGGSSSLNPLTLKDAIEVYDVNTDSWKEEGSIKTPRYDFTSEMINDIIYTFCGYTTTSLKITEGYVIAEDIKLGSEEVRSGKTLIATAITNKGVTTNNDDTFQTMADNIGLIESGSNLPSWYEGWSSSPTDAPITLYSQSDVANNKIYCIYNDYNYCYDPNNNTWESKTPMLTSRSRLNLIAVDDKIYCFGGEISGGNYSTSNDCYDPITDTWTTKEKVINDYYLLSTDPVVSYNHKLYYLAFRVFCYDTISDTWTILGESGFYGDEKIDRAMASVVNGVAYVFGGFSGSFATSAFNRYDINTDTWGSLDNMPIARESGSTCTVNDKIYIMGGHNTNGNLNDNKLYDPSTNTWEDKQSMLNARGNFKLNLIDDIIYAVGGGALNECYMVTENLKSGSEEVRSGKELIANAITDKGISTSPTDSFQTMANNIGLIESNGNAPSWYGNLPSWYTPETIIWVEGEPMPTELVYPLSGKINDYIYVITSQDNYNYNYRYNTNNNTWETKTPTTEIKSEACSLSVVNDKIYCVGGTSATTLCYDPSTDTWSAKANITTPRLYMSVESVGNIIYCISGYINSTSTYTATHECYDVLTDTWTSKSGVSGRAETGSGVVDSNIYVFGGWNGSKVVNTNECYNTLTDTWSTKTVMPSECRQFTASEIDDNIYCMVGTTNYCYNASNNNWSEKTSVPTNAVNTTSVSIGSKIYCFGGRVYSGSNYNYSSRNECYIANNDN